MRWRDSSISIRRAPDFDRSRSRSARSGSTPGEMKQEPAEHSFEAAFKVAERATQRLERGDLTLEKCLEEYEQGARALRDCYTILQSAQRRLEVLSNEVGLAEAESSVEERGASWQLATPSGSLGEVLQRLKDDEGEQEAL